MKNQKSQSGTSVVVSGEQGDKLLAGLQLPGHLGKIVGHVAVTRETLQQEDGVPIAVRIQSKIVKGEDREDAKEGDMRPPDLCNVLNLETGEEQVLIVNVKLKSGLRRGYPDDTYVGRSFALVSIKVPFKGNKTVRDYMVKELLFEPAT